VKTQKTIKALLLLLTCMAILSITCTKQSKKTTTAQATDIPPEFNDPHKSPHELAQFVFTKYDCNSCHTLNNEGKFGYTERGGQLRANSEGCVGLLTSMSVIVHISDAERKPEQRLKAARFNEYGCTVCHQVEPGKLSLTKTGEKLASLHLACTEVQELLTQKQ
jgi:cytochrome c551/c552